MKTSTLKHLAAAAAAIGVALAFGQPARAAQCNPQGGFRMFVAEFSAEARRQGISQRTIDQAFAGVTPNPTVLKLDRNQKHFKVSFEKFVAQRVTNARVTKSKSMLQRHAGLFDSIEAKFGVAREVIVAIWAMETDFGANTGNMSSIRSLATLAHDCRRTELFQGELMAALMIVERGDMTPAQMRGAWAGELGQTQFLASNYLRLAVDFDGDRRRDLIRSVPDALASTANYLKAYGWQRGRPWQPGSANFEVIKQWNKSDNYARAIALFADRLT
ncbi:MAG: lytic murein transglycosylase [Rhodobiaceae bacterium]|nr:lytic murein transglycosylase [Rhodobiaceae bacterium]